MKGKIAVLEENLQYSFKDKNLLIKALTHISSSQENNEVLEFLGDSVINLIISELLIEKFPSKNEGFLSLMRSKLVSREMLNKIAKDLQLKDYIILGESFKNQKITEDLLGNALEAILLSSNIELHKVIQQMSKELGKNSDHKLPITQKDLKELVKKSPDVIRALALQLHYRLSQRIFH